MPSDLDELISLSADEKFDDASGEATGLSDESGGRLFNHPWAAVFAWLLCLSVFTYHYLEPLPKQHDLGVRSVEARLSIAVYHLAHRVESYRLETGHLPDYLFEAWQESDDVTYASGPDGYEITGRAGQFELVFREGDDPQGLIYRINQPGASN